MPPRTGSRIWVRLTVDCSPQAADAVGAALMTLSPNGITVEQDEVVRLTGYVGPYRSHEAVAEAEARAREALLDVPEELLPRPLQVTAEAEPEEDWIETFRSQHPPARIGRIIVKPTWAQWPTADQRALPDDIIVEIDPGLAFGTGQHPTTRICLQEIQDRLRRGARVVDYGCGSGILSIAAAKLGAETVLGLDVDLPAAQIARENAVGNDVHEVVSVAVAGSLDAVRPGWDLIVANINPVIVTREAPRAAEILRPGGCYLCTGIPFSREAEVLDALWEADFEIVPRPAGEWVGFVCTKRGGATG